MQIDNKDKTIKLNSDEDIKNNIKDNSNDKVDKMKYND